MGGKRWARNSGIVDQNVHWSEITNHRLYERVGLKVFRQICPIHSESELFRLKLGRNFLQGMIIQRRDGHSCAGINQLLRDRFSDALTSTGNQCDLVLQHDESRNGFFISVFRSKRSVVVTKDRPE